jgi:hypothetical protein
MPSATPPMMIVAGPDDHRHGDPEVGKPTHQQEGDPEGGDHDGHGREVDPLGEGREKRLLRGVFLGADLVNAPHGEDRAHRRDRHRQEDGVELHRAVPREGGHAQGRRREDRAAVALVEVGAHAGHVAHVVAHVVGDRGGVASVVLGTAVLDLAHEVGPTSAALVKMPPPTRAKSAWVLAPMPKQSIVTVISSSDSGAKPSIGTSQ